MNKEAIDLLKEISNSLCNCELQCKLENTSIDQRFDKVIVLGAAKELSSKIDQALAFLRAEEPKCKTCGGSGEVLDDFNNCGGVAGAFVEVSHIRGEMLDIKKTCPTCKGTGKPEEPPQGEVGALIKTLEIYANTEHKVSQVFYQDLCLKAKEVLDRQAAEIKDKCSELDAECRISQMLLAEQKKLKAEIKKLKRGKDAKSKNNT